MKQKSKSVKEQHINYNSKDKEKLPKKSLNLNFIKHIINVILASLAILAFIETLRTVYVYQQNSPNIDPKNISTLSAKVIYLFILILITYNSIVLFNKKVKNKIILLTIVSPIIILLVLLCLNITSLPPFENFIFSLLDT